ncbi:hypothetical protein L249_4225 [Ophiocordyceps polyrhachis-furcata BCC 54312]|uniref:Uncharacterized protein n=1 Tax=Ophiocordyceps polyrhachis-furcata BCC 54312 TaxID=1330021 RepID=A0A367LBY8_9HYPO|nr:hypothetical protein L249_4225 [Ophiocordyceps polyrhachis-furcata BCC 54312]
MAAVDLVATVDVGRDEITIGGLVDASKDLGLVGAGVSPGTTRVIGREAECIKILLHRDDGVEIAKVSKAGPRKIRLNEAAGDVNGMVEFEMQSARRRLQHVGRDVEPRVRRKGPTTHFYQALLARGPGCRCLWEWTEVGFRLVRSRVGPAAETPSTTSTAREAAGPSSAGEHRWLQSCSAEVGC